MWTKRYIDWAESGFDRDRVNRARYNKNVLKGQVKRLQNLDDYLKNHAASKALAVGYCPQLCSARYGDAW